MRYRKAAFTACNAIETLVCVELRDFIASVLDGTGPVLDASESDTQADRAKPRNPLYWLINNGKDVFSRLKELIGGVFG